jgi:hypothetical protein
VPAVGRRGVTGRHRGDAAAAARGVGRIARAEVACGTGVEVRRSGGPARPLAAADDRG